MDNSSDSQKSDSESLLPGLRSLLLEFFQLPTNASIEQINKKLLSYDQSDPIYQDLVDCRDLLTTEVEFDTYLNKSIYYATTNIYNYFKGLEGNRPLTPQEHLLNVGIIKLLDLEQPTSSFRLNI